MRQWQLLIFFFLLFSSIVKGQSDIIQFGKASYYADKFNGRKTASGEIYNHSKKTAAHKSLDFGTRVRVTNLENKKSVVVIINDRGPFVKGRIIDLSKSAAEKLDFLDKGITDVKIEVINSADAKKSNSKKQKSKKK
ncbi:MAG: septal ring lytic transglycosylase RlpA family protein [Bacteroidales bacterium]|nr:septal ring lytic transglycosylase RlpA family protein [Bacteroidales bacterium]